MVSLFGIFVDMLFVCELKRREKAAFAEIKDLSDKLREENELLQESSLTDTLTGIGNRLALRKDFDSYRGMDLHVVMLDVDNFKSINDRYGHMQGDNILAETGRLISDTFGREHCYRYGGDEFLMIIPGIGDDEFIEKLHHIMNSRPVIEEDEAKARAGYSIGYISGKAEHNYTLRGMLDRSDELMYEAKTSGKNKIVGDN
jgi:diguanylate cyclase (GGDEF)-like protein